MDRLGFLAIARRSMAISMELLLPTFKISTCPCSFILAINSSSKAGVNGCPLQSTTFSCWMLYSLIVISLLWLFGRRSFPLSLWSRSHYHDLFGQRCSALRAIYVRRGSFGSTVAAVRAGNLQ